MEQSTLKSVIFVFLLFKNIKIKFKIVKRIEKFIKRSNRNRKRKIIDLKIFLTIIQI